MPAQLKLLCLLTALAGALAACDDEIVDLDLPKDASSATREGAAPDAGTADAAVPDAAIVDDAPDDASEAGDALDDAADVGLLNAAEAGSDGAPE